MAAAAVSASLTASSAGARLCEFEGLKASAKPAQVQRLAMVPKSMNNKGALGTRSYLGSPTNLIIVGSTTLLLIAGRFGLAPSANRKSTAGLKLVDRNSGLQTGDPAGFTIADTLAFGSMGHLIGVGVVLGLKATGGL